MRKKHPSTKNFIKLVITAVLVVLFQSCGDGNREISVLSDIAVTVSDNNRQYFFTNKKNGFFYGNTNLVNEEINQGWYVKGKRIFSDYKVYIGSDSLLRNNAETTVLPHKLIRKFGNIEEELFFADSIDFTYIKISHFESNDVYFQLNGIEISSEIKKDENSAQIPIKSGILTVYSPTDINFINSEKDKAEFIFNTAEEIEIGLIFTKNPLKNADEYLNEVESLIQRKSKRINDILNRTKFFSESGTLNNALAWAKINLDALIMERHITGLISGLPQLDDYWGRDNFISIYGAALYPGNYSEAEEILKSFAEYQSEDFRNPNFGRIPNRISPYTTIYNSAEVTPLFVSAALEYYKFTNDKEFLAFIYPKIKTAANAIIERDLDENGFIYHEDDETWMDAIGMNGPYTPRGTRANEVQSYWFEQLEASKIFGMQLGDTLFAAECFEAQKKLESSFKQFFTDTSKGIIFDHIKDNGSIDSTIRSNAFISLNRSGLFHNAKIKLKILDSLLSATALEYGITSISQYDKQFHPYYEFRPYYLSEEAFHNGMIWYWQFGEVIRALNNFGKTEMSWHLTKELIRLSKDIGTIGAIPEMGEPYPRNKYRRIEGTPINTMATAEFVNSIYRHYLGVYPQLPANYLLLIPSLPDDFNVVTFDQIIGKNKLEITYDFEGSGYLVSINPVMLDSPLEIGLSLITESGANFQMQTVLYPKEPVKFELSKDAESIEELQFFRGEVKSEIEVELFKDPVENRELYDKLDFAEKINPDSSEIFLTNKYKLLTKEIVKRYPDSSAAIIFNETDEENDEMYSYPKNEYFESGILDLTGFILKEDSTDYYFELNFKNLVNPGWNPEYGFQLTFAAIAIQNGKLDSLNTEIGYNSNYLLQGNRAYSKLIAIGGGIEISDFLGRNTGYFIPEENDIENTLGSDHTNSVTFSIPKSILGIIDVKTKISILVGSQEDHGSASIGNFRDVNRKQSEWYGGGKWNPTSHNIYDFLLIN